jgi:hypothetical protein
MGTLILDDALKARLNGLNEQLEIRDESGKIVGRFLPEDQYRRMLYDWAKAEFAREEAEEAAKGIVRKWDGTNGKTTAEVLSGLRDLEARLQREERERAPR